MNHKSYFAFGEIHEDLQGDGNDFDVRHGSVAALDEVGQDLDGSAVVGGHLDTTVGGVVSWYFWKIKIKEFDKGSCQ